MSVVCTCTKSSPFLPFKRGDVLEPKDRDRSAQLPCHDGASAQRSEISGSAAWLTARQTCGKASKYIFSTVSILVK